MHNIFEMTTGKNLQPRFLSPGMISFRFDGPIKSFAAAAAKSLQSCLTLCDPIDGSPSVSLCPGILQARKLEWLAISFSNAWKCKVKVKSSVMSDSYRPHGLQPTRLLRPWDFPGKSTGVGCHCLFQSRVLQTSKRWESCTTNSALQQMLSEVS